MTTITAIGHPITQGSKVRTQWGMRDSNGDRLKPWRDTVTAAAIDAHEGQAPIDGPAKTRRPCSIDGCEKPAKGRGWCGAHWLRWRKYGDPLGAAPLPPQCRPQHVGCKVDDCDEKHHSFGFCSMHAARFKKWGDPNKVGPRTPGRNRVNSPKYTTVHRRLLRDVGSASEHACVDCGGTAKEWSYDGLDAGELTEGTLRYSIDPAHYVPRCVPCHRAHDAEHRTEVDK